VNHDSLRFDRFEYLDDVRALGNTLDRCIIVALSVRNDLSETSLDGA